MKEGREIRAINVCYRDEDRGVPKNYFIREPSAENLRPTPREERIMRGLLNWQERSLKVHWDVGKPVGI